MPLCIKCKTKNNDVGYFKFPDDKEIKKKWIAFLKSNHLRLKENSTLCAKHFAEDCFTTDADKRILKPDSVPSIEVVRNPKRKKNDVSKKSTKKCILCGNNSADLSYFTVPKDEETKQKWEKFCEFELGNGNYSLCHLHFKRSDMRMENGKRKLQLNALPSIFFDDYQFEFIPVDRKTNTEDCSNVVESITNEPNMFNSNNPTSKTNQSAREESIISIDYSEFNTPPRTPTFNTSMSSEIAVQNSTTNDIVNIFIPNYEDSNENAGNTCTNDETVSKSIQTTSGTTVSVYGLNGRRKRLSYPGDFKSEEINSLEVAKFAIENLRTVVNKKNQSIKTLSMKVKRLESRNAALKETIRQLKAEKAAKEAKEKEDLFEVKGWWDS